jgi:hypothetical protein
MLAGTTDLAGKARIWGKVKKNFGGKTGVRAKVTQRGDRSTRRTTHPWVKTNKFAQEPTRGKILGMAIFGGDFRNRSRTKQK